MPLSRRGFLTVTGVVALSSCGGKQEEEPLSGGIDASNAVDTSVEDVTESEEVAVEPDVTSDVEPDAPPIDPDLGPIPRNPAAFPTGLMAGDAEPTRAMIWTKYTGTRTLRARVSEVKGGVAVRVVLERVVKPTAAGYVHLDVGDLDPGTEYQYAFIEHDGTKYVGRSDAGRFCTAIAESALSPIVFGGTSCNHLAGAPFPALEHAADEKLDFFVHCGDHIYGDTAETLAEYRAIYDKYWAVKHLSAVHRSTGIYSIWDDHEVVNNWASDTVPAARVDAARRAFFEYRAFRRNPTHPDRLWRSFRWGRTAEFFILDVRSERLRKNRLLASGAANPEAQIISKAQMDWLKAGLLASKAVFKFIVTSKYITGPNDLDNVDSWPGYPAQRNELLQHILKNELKGVWFLTGDVHKGIIDKVEPSGAASALREIYMGPSGSGGEPRPDLNRCNGTGQREVFLDVRSYTKLRADPVARTLEVEFVGESGSVLCKKKYPA